MISTFDYLASISKAYQDYVCESFPPDVKQLLDTKYKSKYKSDGYDQFGVDINGKNRKGKPVMWRYSEKWYGDVAKLERLLKAAKRAEDVLLGVAKHNYDRNGFDVLGFDKQGFDIDDRDILGHSGSEYGTAEYDAMEKEREHARHNLHSKNGMREYNYSKTHAPLTREQYAFIINSYKESIRTPNPKESFARLISPIFLKQKPDGKLYIDKTSLKYFLNKFKFSEKPNFVNMSSVEYVNSAITKFYEQLNRVFRPESPSMFLDINTDITNNDNNDGLKPTECVLNITLKPEISSNKYYNADDIFKKVVIAANRIKTIFPYSGFDCWTVRGNDFAEVHFVVSSDSHANIENKLNTINAQDDFDATYKLGPYENNLAEKLSKHK